jgi:hypothetical protein
MVGGDRPTSPARRRSRRRPDDLGGATAVQSRGDGSGGRSAHGRCRAWPRPSRSSAAARRVPGPLGAQRRPRRIGLIGHSTRLYCPPCGRLGRRRGAMRLEVKSLTRRVRIELEDEDNDSSSAILLIPRARQMFRSSSGPRSVCRPSTWPCCAPRSRPPSSWSAPSGLTSGKPTPRGGAEGVGSVEGCSERFLCMSRARVDSWMTKVQVMGRLRHRRLQRLFSTCYGTGAQQARLPALRPALIDSPWSWHGSMGR